MITRASSVNRHHIITKIIVIIISMIMTMWAIVSCTGNRSQMVMNHAESLIEDNPDSALTLLKGLKMGDFDSDAQRARYALLMSMALELDYTDTVTFDILQPAIDYYSRRGTPDEKLRTYYCQGRIFQNRGEMDDAFTSYVKGLENSGLATDTLTIVRTLVAQSSLYYEFYDFESYTEANLKAADLSRPQSCGINNRYNSALRRSRQVATLQLINNL